GAEERPPGPAAAQPAPSAPAAPSAPGRAHPDGGARETDSLVSISSFSFGREDTRVLLRDEARCDGHRASAAAAGASSGAGAAAACGAEARAAALGPPRRGDVVRQLDFAAAEGPARATEPARAGAAVGALGGAGALPARAALGEITNTAGGVSLGKQSKDRHRVVAPDGAQAPLQDRQCPSSAAGALLDSTGHAALEAAPAAGGPAATASAGPPPPPAELSPAASRASPWRAEEEEAVEPGDGPPEQSPCSGTLVSIGPVASPTVLQEGSVIGTSPPSCEPPSPAQAGLGAAPHGRSPGSGARSPPGAGAEGHACTATGGGVVLQLRLCSCGRGLRLDPPQVQAAAGEAAPGPCGSPSCHPARAHEASAGSRGGAAGPLPQAASGGRGHALRREPLAQLGLRRSRSAPLGRAAAQTPRRYSFVEVPARLQERTAAREPAQAAQGAGARCTPEPSIDELQSMARGMQLRCLDRCRLLHPRGLGPGGGHALRGAREGRQPSALLAAGLHHRRGGCAGGRQ
ncbi:unnamed protein product, partial [Prorocentrum cordatum]